MTEPLFQGKPWEFRGRRMERNAPQGTRCSPGCAHPKVTEGTNVCLCTVCHEVFNSVGWFDRHRKDGWCVDPLALGLTRNSRGVWRESMGPEKILALNERRETESGEDTEAQG